MASLLGTHIGPYEILSLLGAGGMGEVYRARDSKLGREVALKILSPAFAVDPERMARFQREAQVLATLNHPGIAAIYGLEESATTRALVMELVEGQTLAERVKRGRVPLDEALRIALLIAEALETAHEKGIIHRDLKPENIKITPEGKTKILDFGLAKATDLSRSSADDSSRSPTIDVAETHTGMIMGTAGYMSPEQARGKPLDKRTDIWAFGCVCYETLAGRMAFPGLTASDCVAAVLGKEPAWEALPVSAPRRLCTLLRRCLQKDPQRRLRDIGDARLELEDMIAAPAEETPAHKQRAVTRRAAIGTLAGAAGLAAGGVLGSRFWRGIAARSLTQFRIPLREGEIAVPTWNKWVAISPDGRHLAFNSVSRGVNNVFAVVNFYLHSLRELEPKAVPKPAVGLGFFSPDSRWVGFLAGVRGGEVQKLSLDGGAPVAVCALDGYRGATWAADGAIYLISESPGGLSRVPATGGQLKEAAKVDLAKGERQYIYPWALPGGKAILLTVGTADSETFDDAQIAVFDATTGKTNTLVEGGMSPSYAPSGHLVFGRGGNLLAVRFDPNRLAVSGEPFKVLEGVLMSGNTGVANYDVSASGDLAYFPGGEDKGQRTLVWVDREGRSEPLKLLPRPYLHPRVSPDMKQLAIEIEGPNHNFYVYDFARDVLSQITNDGVSHWPVWSPDGSQLVYRSGRMMEWKMWEVPANRSRPAVQLPGVGASQNAESLSPDGHELAYTSWSPGSTMHVMVESLTGGHESHPISDINAVAGSPKFSPDGRWVAYCSNETKTPQVYVQAFPGPGAKIQVSSDGGTDPVWKRTGDELYFRKGDQMLAVVVSTAPAFRAGHPRVLWQGRYSHGMSTSCGPPGPTSSNYDVTADGKRFLMIKDDAPDMAVSRQLVVVLDWADEVRRLSASA